MGNELSFIIRAIDKATGVMRGVTSNASRMASSVAGSIASMMGISVSLGGVFYGIKKAIEESFRFETAATQFSVLLGSLDAAKTRIEDLKRFAAETPFEFNEIAKASRTLGVFSNNALGTEASLRIVGDAAAAVGQPFSEVANWVGRTYSAIKNGQPFGEAAQRLGEMGIMSGDTRLKLEQMQSAGASNIAIWDEFEKSLKKSEGGMEKLSKTGDGLVSTLMDGINAALTQVGDTMQSTAKDAIKDMIDWLEKLQSDGTLTVWAEETMTNLKDVADRVKVTSAAFADSTFVQSIQNIAAQVGATSTYLGARAGGSSVSEAESRANKEFAMNGTGAARDRAVAKLGYDPKAEQDKSREERKLEAWRKKSADSAQKNMEGELEAIGAGSDRAKVEADMKKTADEKWKAASAASAEKEAAEELAALAEDQVQQSLNEQARMAKLKEERKGLEEDLVKAKRQEVADGLNARADALNADADLRLNGAPKMAAAFNAMVGNNDAAAADAKDFDKKQKRYDKLLAKEDSGKKLSKSEMKFLDQMGSFKIANAEKKIAADLQNQAAKAVIDSKTTLDGIQKSLAFLDKAMKGG